ncbi:hypothetical protein [Halopiger thermotolerans]
MGTTNTQRTVAKWGMRLSVLIGALGLLYFTTRGEVVTGIVVGGLFGVGSYWEYKRRMRDLDRAEAAERTRDPFEERERRR